MPRSRLSADDRVELLARYRAGETRAALAEAFGVHVSTVRYHTIGVVPPRVAAARRRKLAPDQRALLKNRWKAGASYQSLQAAFGVSAATVARVIKGRTRSPQRVQREQARRSASDRTKRDLPRRYRGTASVLLTPHRSGSVILGISRELYRQLGAPEHLDVERYGTRLMLRPGTQHLVHNRGAPATPRITIGATLRAALRMPNAGRFAARFGRLRRPHIAVELTAMPDGQRQADDADADDH